MKRSRQLMSHKIWLTFLFTLVAIFAAAPLGVFASASDETDPLHPEESAIASTEVVEVEESSARQYAQSKENNALSTIDADNDEEVFTLGADTEPPNSPVASMVARHCGDDGGSDNPFDDSPPDAQPIVTFLYNYLEGNEDIYLDTSVNINKAVAPPPFPQRSEYAFVGWYQESVCENAWDFDTPIRENLFLYAKWLPIPPVPPDNTDGESAGNVVAPPQKASKSGHTNSTSTKDPVVDLKDWGIGADNTASPSPTTDAVVTPPAPIQAVADSSSPAVAASGAAGNAASPLVEDISAAAVLVSMDTAQALSSRILVLPTVPLTVVPGNTADELLISDYLREGTAHIPVVNMSLALYTSVVSIVLAITLLIPRPDRLMADTIWRLFAIATGAVTAVSCLLTQSLQNNAGVVDRWTTFGVVMCVAQLSFIVIMRLIYRENRPHPKDTDGEI